MAATIAAIGSLLAGIGAVANVLFGRASVSVPKLPVFKIPEEDLKLLSQQIQANVAISEEARKAAIEALQNYNMGRLSPAYEALYNEYARERMRRLMQELAARGFTPGSTEYNRAMAELATELAAYRAQLLRQQLDDALKVAGLSETTIKELYSKWSAQSMVTAGQASTLATQAQLRLKGAEVMTGAISGLGEAVRSIEKGIEGLESILKRRGGVTGTTGTTGTAQTQTTQGTTTSGFEGFSEKAYFWLSDVLPKIPEVKTPEM